MCNQNNVLPNPMPEYAQAYCPVCKTTTHWLVVEDSGDFMLLCGNAGEEERCGAVGYCEYDFTDFVILYDGDYVDGGYLTGVRA